MIGSGAQEGGAAGAGGISALRGSGRGQEQKQHHFEPQKLQKQLKTHEKT